MPDTPASAGPSGDDATAAAAPPGTTPGPREALAKIFASRRSMECGLAALAAVATADALFRFKVFPVYSRAVMGGVTAGESFYAGVGLSYMPIVWILLTSMVLATVILVITFASQKIPKLIDLYLEDRRTLGYIWLLLWGAAHAVAVKALLDMGYDVAASGLLNAHLLLPAATVAAFPFNYYILKGTKPQNVINQLVAQNQRLIRRLSGGKAQWFARDARRVNRIQGLLFQMLNQLDDLLVYVPYKEPKAAIITGVGDLLCYYAERKNRMPERAFLVGPAARGDVAFRTIGNLEAMEADRTFYEQKGLRMIGGAYQTLLETRQFDLGTLCAAQLARVGAAAVASGDDPLEALVLLRLNTQFRFALKHGAKNNEPRNLYNLVFQYGQFLLALVENRRLARVKEGFFYLRFYAVECYKGAARTPSLAFILDTLAAEMAKILTRARADSCPREIQAQLLAEFLLMDNPPGIDRRENRDFYIHRNSVRLLQIGMGLHYLSVGDEEFAREVARDTVHDLELMDRPQFEKVMQAAFFRLRVSGPTFWEDTDRGNLNIYYTPHADQIGRFQELQAEELDRALAAQAALAD